MALKHTYWIPHGDEIIDLPDQESRIMAERITASADVDDTEVAVIISPHGIGLSRSMGVIMTENLLGRFRLASGSIYGKYRNDRVLAGTIARDNPTLAETVTFATGSGPKSVFPLDFGSLIPLQFFRRRDVVSIGQPRLDRKNDLIDFGRSLYRILEGYERSVSMLFSADMAHTHSSSGPYGYSPDAEKYDEMVLGMFGRGDFSGVDEISDSMVKNAKPDSYWNLLILRGFAEEGQIRMKREYYYVAEYFGMLFAHD